MYLHCSSFSLDLNTPKVMGVLNVTPDSFADGGRYTTVDAALTRVEQMLKEGAALIDVGGESTRPGAATVSVTEELQRVVPVIAAIVSRFAIPVSIDSSKPEVMYAALQAGAVLINDVYALRAPGALRVAADSGAGVCLMHMQGQPATMQQQPNYQDVVHTVQTFLEERVQACTAAGIERQRLMIDPGIGFGKTLSHNLTLLARLTTLHALQLPILIGTSRKSLLGQLTGRAVHERLHGGLALTTAAVLAGAKMIRTHDVAATVDAIQIAVALQAAGYSSSTALAYD